MNNKLISKKLIFASVFSMVFNAILMLLLFGNDFYFFIELNEDLKTFFAICIVVIPVISLIFAIIAKIKNPKSSGATINIVISIMIIVFALAIRFMCFMYDFRIDSLFSAPWPDFKG